MAVMAGVVGCSAAPPPSASTATSEPTAAPNEQDGGVTLDTLGWNNGPAAQVSLPEKVQISQRVDQSNVITAVLDAPDGPTTAQWLARTLPEGGFTVTDHSERAVLFTGHGWDGSFTSNPEVSAITLRRQVSP